MDNKGQSKKKLIEDARERLRWYTLEASEEEFDVQEVDALVNLLNTLEPQEEFLNQSSKQAVDEFWEYCKMRDMDEREKRSVASKIPKQKKKAAGKAWEVIPHTYKYIGAAAAAFFVVLVTGSSISAVNAEKGGGFFHWLKKDQEGVTMITSPEKLGDMVQMKEGEIYTEATKVPQQYQKYLVDYKKIKLLEDYALESINIGRFNGFDKLSQKYVCESREETVILGVFSFHRQVMLTREIYADYEFQYRNEVEGMEQEVYLKKDANGEEYVICFYHEKEKYFVQGMQDVESLNKLALEYMGMVVE